MSVRLRLTRVGSKKNPIWRVVVADQRSPRDGRFIETIGHYNPQTEPSQIRLDDQRLRHWLHRGAQPTDTVRKLIRAHSAAVRAPGAAGPEPEEPAAAAPESEEASAADSG
jgi:small subunit ribosomal protein S16